MNENYKLAWNDYLNLCDESGTKSFLSLLKTTNLKSPFEKECIEDIVEEVRNFLKNFHL